MVVVLWGTEDLGLQVMDHADLGVVLRFGGLDESLL
jgi:hypothetical protein